MHITNLYPKFNTMIEGGELPTMIDRQTDRQTLADLRRDLIHNEIARTQRIDLLTNVYPRFNA